MAQNTSKKFHQLPRRQYQNRTNFISERIFWRNLVWWGKDIKKQQKKIPWTVLSTINNIWIYIKLRHKVLVTVKQEGRAAGHDFFFFVQCHHMSFVDFVVLPPGHGRSVTDFWGWDAHEAQLRCPDGVWVVIEEDVAPGGALNLNSTNLPRPWSPWESSPSRKIPTVEPHDLMTSSQRLWPLDHEAGLLWNVITWKKGMQIVL